MAETLNPGALAGATGAQDAKADQAGKPETNRPRRAKQGALAIIHSRDGTRRVEVKGRNLWALQALMVAGSTGITAISNPAPRLSAYIHRLRALGLDISTEHEAHGGPYSGHHAKYRLHSDVELEAPDDC